MTTTTQASAPPPPPPSSEDLPTLRRTLEALQRQCAALGVEEKALEAKVSECV